MAFVYIRYVSCEQNGKEKNRTTKRVVMTCVSRGGLKFYLDQFSVKGEAIYKNRIVVVTEDRLNMKTEQFSVRGEAIYKNRIVVVSEDRLNMKTNYYLSVRGQIIYNDRLVMSVPSSGEIRRSVYSIRIVRVIFPVQGVQGYKSLTRTVTIFFVC